MGKAEISGVRIYDTPTINSQDENNIEWVVQNPVQPKSLDELKVVSSVTAIRNPDGSYEIQDKATVEFQRKQQESVVHWYDLMDKNGRRYFSHPDYFVESKNDSSDQELVRLYPDDPLDRDILLNQGVEL